MEIQQIRYFLALCETLNFTRAAQRCGVTQPSLTKSIQKLEDEMGGPLFRRERNLSHLTDLGRLVRPHLEAVFNASELARLEAEGWRRLDKAPLRLAVMCTIGPQRLIGFLKRLRREVPTLELQIKDAPGAEVIRLLLEGEVDAGILGMPALPERFDCHPLYSERYVVAFASGHRFEALDRVPLAALAAEDYLARENCEFDAHFAQLGIPDPADVRVVYSTEREDWIQSMLVSGLGCAVMPEFLPMLPGIGTRVLIEPEVRRDIRLATVSGRRFSPALQAFIRLAKSHVWTSRTGE